MLWTSCYVENVSAGTLISLDEYLHSSYSPDREYRDGMLVERNVGDNAHALLQLALGAYLHRRRKQWGLQVYTELRIQVRHDWYPIPDVCVYAEPAPQERFPATPPLLWVEILSESDAMVEVWSKANDLVANGVPYVWIIDPNSLESELRSPAGTVHIEDKTLHIPNSLIVIPLGDVVAE
jgi:Uma2 family endonuclease